MSDKGANGILAVPVDAGAVETAEHLFESTAELDELGEARQDGRGIHVAHPATTRYGGAKGECITVTLVLRYRRIEVPRRHPPVVEAVAAPLDHLAVNGGRVVVLLDQLDVHVAGKAHGDRHVRARRLSAVHGVFSAEVLEHEPGADA